MFYIRNFCLPLSHEGTLSFFFVDIWNTTLFWFWMKRNGNDDNKQDSTSQYCYVTIAVLYLKLKEETIVFQST